jgi:hypothetical protein
MNLQVYARRGTFGSTSATRAQLGRRAQERDKRSVGRYDRVLRGRAKHLDRFVPSVSGVQHAGGSVQRRRVLILEYRRGSVR